MFYQLKMGCFNTMSGSKLPVLGMVIPPLIGNAYNGYIKPYYWVDDHPLFVWKSWEFRLTRSHMLQPQTSTCLGKQPLLLTSSTRINIPNRHSGPRKVYILFSRRQQIQCYTTCSFNIKILFCVCVFSDSLSIIQIPDPQRALKFAFFCFFFGGGRKYNIFILSF